MRVQGLGLQGAGSGKRVWGWGFVGLGFVGLGRATLLLVHAFHAHFTVLLVLLRAAHLCSPSLLNSNICRNQTQKAEILVPIVRQTCIPVFDFGVQSAVMLTSRTSSPRCSRWLSLSTSKRRSPSVTARYKPRQESNTTVTTHQQNRIKCTLQIERSSP